MKNFFSTSTIILYLYASMCVSHAEPAAITESEVQSVLNNWYQAIDQGDIEKLISLDAALEDGFGFRSNSPRQRLSEADTRALWESFYGGMDYYNIGIEDIQIKVFGATAVAWGVQSENFKRVGAEPESLVVRFSFTLVKHAEDSIEIVLAHRDIQKFDDNGRYIPYR